MNKDYLRVKKWRIENREKYLQNREKYRRVHGMVKLSNGIVLCKFHHPIKRVEEIKMIPIFSQLVLTH